MTVKELIEELQKHPPDATVYVYSQDYEDSGGSVELDTIEQQGNPASMVVLSGNVRGR